MQRPIEDFIYCRFFPFAIWRHRSVSQPPLRVTPSTLPLSESPPGFLGIQDAEVTSSNLTHVINLSIGQGVFQTIQIMLGWSLSSRKIAELMLGIIGQSQFCQIFPWFERLVYEQVEEYLIRHDLYELQSGFRAAHSTDTCLIHLFDYVRQSFDFGTNVAMLLLDLQKAFSTVTAAVQNSDGHLHPEVISSPLSSHTVW